MLFIFPPPSTEHCHKNGLVKDCYFVVLQIMSVDEDSDDEDSDDSESEDEETSKKVSILLSWLLCYVEV